MDTGLAAWVGLWYEPLGHARTAICNSLAVGYRWQQTATAARRAARAGLAFCCLCEKHLGLFLGRKAAFDLQLWEGQCRSGVKSACLFVIGRPEAGDGLRRDVLWLLRRKVEVRRRLGLDAARPCSLAVRYEKGQEPPGYVARPEMRGSMSVARLTCSATNWIFQHGLGGRPVYVPILSPSVKSQAHLLEP